MQSIKEVLLSVNLVLKYRRELSISKKNCKQVFQDKKVILIGHNSDKQGAALLLENIAKELTVQGFDVCILIRKPGEMIPRYCQIAPTYVFFGKNHFNNLIERLKKKGYRNAICNTTVNGDLVKNLKDRNYNVISFVHELENAIIDLNIEQRARTLAEYSDVVIFPSTYVLNKFKIFSNEITNYLILPQGLYLNKNHVVNKNDALKYLHDKYQIKSGSKILLNVATGELRKGFDLFVTMAADLSEKEDIIWIWVGDYSRDLYLSTLEKIGSNNIPNLILPGYINNPEELAMFYDAANLLILTSREEPFGSIVLEAFKSKTPVIGFENAGGFVDTVIKGFTGELVEYENIKKMEFSILNLLYDHKKIEQLEENCSKFVLGFSFDKYIEEIVKLVK